MRIKRDIFFLPRTPLPFLSRFPRHSHKPELRLPSDQNFPETLDFRHLQLDLFRHHGCFCHGDDVQLICAGDTERRCQDLEAAQVCKNSLVAGNRLDPATFTHGKGTLVSVCTASVCLWDRPLETGQHIFHGDPVTMARGGSGGLIETWSRLCLWPWQSLLGPGSWISAPLTANTLPCPSLQDQVQLEAEESFIIIIL